MSRILDMWAGMTGAVLDYAGTDAPTGWLMCYGQSLLRSDYPNLFARIGTTYGAVDAAHFNVPDARGRVLAGKDNMGGAPAGRVTTAGAGINGTTLGAVGGAETHTLTAPQMPTHTHANTLTDPGHNHAITDPGHGHNINYNNYGLSSTGGSGTGTPYVAPGWGVSGGAVIANSTGISIQNKVSGVTITNASQGSGQAHLNVQPTLVLNKIIKT